MATEMKLLKMGTVCLDGTKSQLKELKLRQDRLAAMLARTLYRASAVEGRCHARLAAQLAARVAEILKQETGLDPKAVEFAQLSAQYLQVP